MICLLYQVKYGDISTRAVQIWTMLVAKKWSLMIWILVLSPPMEIFMQGINSILSKSCCLVRKELAASSVNLGIQILSLWTGTCTTKGSGANLARLCLFYPFWIARTGTWTIAISPFWIIPIVCSIQVLLSFLMIFLQTAAHCGHGASRDWWRLPTA
jgi:hypothetical protein